MPQLIIGQKNVFTYSWVVTGSTGVLVLAGNPFWDWGFTDIIRIEDTTTGLPFGLSATTTFSNTFAAGLPTFTWNFTNLPAGTASGDTLLVYMEVTEEQLEISLIEESGGSGGGSTGINGLNGTTNIGLGGTLTEDTNIEVGTKQFTIISSDFGGGVEIQNDGTTLTTTIGGAGNDGQASVATDETVVASDAYGHTITLGKDGLDLSFAPLKAVLAGNLPVASTNTFVILGVTDALAATPGTVVAGGGSNKVIVYSNSVNWIIL